LLNHYKSLFHLQKFVAYTLTDNFRAITLLEIIGFKREGYLVKNRKVGSEFKDEYVYGLVH